MTNNNTEKKSRELDSVMDDFIDASQIELVEDSHSFAKVNNKDLEEKIIDSYSNQNKHSKLEHRRSIRTLRIQFAWAIFFLILLWIALVFLILISNATGVINNVLILHITDLIISPFLIGLMLYSLCAIIHKFGLFLLLYACRPAVKMARQTPELLSLLFGAYKQNKLGIKIGIFIGSIIAFFYWGSTYRTLIVTASNTIFSPVESSTLNVLLGCTTVNVIGIFMAVMYWLFPKKNPDEKK